MIKTFKNETNKKSNHFLYNAGKNEENNGNIRNILPIVVEYAKRSDENKYQKINTKMIKQY